MEHTRGTCSKIACLPWPNRFIVCFMRRRVTRLFISVCTLSSRSARVHVFPLCDCLAIELASIRATATRTKLIVFFKNNKDINHLTRKTNSLYKTNRSYNVLQNFVKCRCKNALQGSRSTFSHSFKKQRERQHEQKLQKHKQRFDKELHPFSMSLKVIFFNSNSTIRRDFELVYCV